MAKNVTTRQVGKKHFARVDGGIEFYVGTEVTYQGNLGLVNESAAAPLYSPGNYPNSPCWASFIAPTADCESQNSFQCLNTYDRAAFTFGFLQYAAHVPGGDFVQWFRRLLALPKATEWFPDLTLQNGHVAKLTITGCHVLEDNSSTQGLMTFFNPRPDAIDVDEVINAAKLMGWQAEDQALCDVQVSVGVSIFQTAMRIYARKYNLDGQPDTICAVIADIRHQGRGTSSEIMAALHSGNPLEALLAIGSDDYAERCKTLRTQIGKAVVAGIMGRLVYSAADGEFLPPTA